jgi:hypothetical protein
MIRWLPALLTAFAAASALAHGGEDHGGEAAAPPPALAGQAPRASAQTEEFELVVVLDRGGAAPPVLTLYLDRYGSNQPVADAAVEVESGAFKATARPAAPGVYTVPGAAFAAPGRHPLTVSVQTADSADLLDATLQTEAAAPVPAAAVAGIPRWAWALPLAVLLAAAGYARTRRRSATPTSKVESA